jgi:hypothetical protein
MNEKNNIFLSDNELMLLQGVIWNGIYDLEEIIKQKDFKPDKGSLLTEKQVEEMIREDKQDLEELYKKITDVRDAEQ